MSEDEARELCEYVGWVDMRDDEESCSSFFNLVRGIFNCTCDTWLELYEEEKLPENPKPVSEIVMTFHNPNGDFIPEGILVKDCRGNTIGEVIESYCDSDGRRCISVNINSVVADGLFEMQLSVKII